MKAMILAAGLGTRMRPLTDNCPKPLLPVAGKPLIQHHIERLVSCGITELVINLAYRGEQIEGYLGDGSNWGATIHYSREGEALETGGGIFHALPALSDPKRCFLVVNGDIWSDFDYRELPSLGQDLAHLVMVDNPVHHPQGDFSLRQGRLHEARQGASLTYSGISLLSPELFSGCKAEAFPLAPLLRAAIAAGRVGGSYFGGRWIDVGTPQRLELLRSELSAAHN